MNKAERIVESLLEGTVIVLNAGSDDDGASADVLSQVRGLIGQQGEKPDGFVERQSPSGRKWSFRINRDPNGNISTIEAQEK